MGNSPLRVLKRQLSGSLEEKRNDTLEVLKLIWPLCELGWASFWCDTSSKMFSKLQWSLLRFNLFPSFFKPAVCCSRDGRRFWCFNPSLLSQTWNWAKPQPSHSRFRFRLHVACQSGLKMSSLFSLQKYCELRRCVPKFYTAKPL